MTGYQRWVTYASEDSEGLKSVILARSLKLSITTRSSMIFISPNVSYEIWSLLQSEFDTCIRITKEECLKYPELPFSLVAKIFCWKKLTKLRRFVFLDCNCMVLKNSDGLFKGKVGVGLVYDEGTNDICAPVIVGNARNQNDGILDVIESLYSESNKANFYKDIKETKRDLLLEEIYYSPMYLRRSYAVNGSGLQITYLADIHPLDYLLRTKETPIAFKNLGIFEQTLFRRCAYLFCLNGLKDTTKNIFQVNGKLDILENAAKSLEFALPDMNVLEELKDSIAIVGMGFRFPGANNIDEFWELLIKGQDGIIKVPGNRWNKDQCFIRGDNTRDTQAGFLKCPIDEFDAKFFGMNAAELSCMDPQQRLTLQVVWEALENSGIDPQSLKNTITGVFGGWWRNDYKEMLQESGLNETEFFRAYMGNALGTLTGRISHFLELTGPSISTESGCSTSIVGVDMACNSLRNENCDVGLAVGVNLLLHPFSIDAMNAVVAMDGHCKTFDAKADGFGRAEGCGVLVLKRFSDAVSHGDRIWGLIRGSAVVQEGPSKSLGTPTKQCEALAMQLALERAGVEPKDVSFVETHGTGTPVGDPLELAAVAEIYSKGRKDILTIGSVKTNIGHTESVSGIAGIVKTVLALQHEIIPPHLNLETLNPEINLECIPAQIPLTPVKWKRQSDNCRHPRIAGVSSFGITGTDAHVIIQETPDMIRYKDFGINDSRPSKILTFSAKSPEALENVLSNHKAFLSKTTSSLEDIEYTASIGRGHFTCRTAVVGESMLDILDKLEKKSFQSKQTPSEPPKLCFLFTGQGSQYPDMAKDLYSGSLVFKTNVERCEVLLKKACGISLKESIWGSQSSSLSRTLYSQTSIFCIEFCLLKLWESWGVKPDYALGHSLGEFVAAVAAGILTFEDALKLVIKRSQLIDALPQGNMLVLRENVLNVKKLMEHVFRGTKKRLDIAAVNSPEQTVVAGSDEIILEFAKVCKNNDIKATILEATHAFHSYHMDPMLDEYRRTAETIQYSCPKVCTFVSGMEGRIFLKENNNKIDAEYWVRHTREGVMFMDASKAVLESGCTTFLEIGPQPVLSSLTMINSDLVDLTTPLMCLPSIRRKEKDWDTILTSLSKLYVNGVYINWSNFLRYSQAKKVDLPFYPFQSKSYWMEVKDDGTIPIHPLVGSPIPNPSSIKLFQNHIDVNRTSFLKDHVIGNKLIFPGAGFLEMCLVSGHAAVQCTEGGYTSPITPLTIENFQIEAPLCLNEQGRTHLQVVVSTEDSGETRTTIYSKLILDEETHKWIRHATGVFSPYDVEFLLEKERQPGAVDSLHKIKLRCTEKSVSDHNYDKLESYGLKFGPKFQTLKGMWKSKGEAYFEIDVTDDIKRYVCHPVIIDAMFQALIAFTKPDAKALHVPISISKFIWISEVDTSICYIYCCEPSDPSITKEFTVKLFNSTGKLLALMIGAELIETTVTNIASLLEAQRTPYLSMYEEVYRESLGPFERRINIEEADSPYFSTVMNFMNEHTDRFNNFLEEEQKNFENCNKLFALYMINTLIELGLKVQVGDKICLNELVQNLKIQNNIRGFLRYMLLELVKEGFLQVSKWDREKMEFIVLKSFPTQSQVQISINSLLSILKPLNITEVECVSSIAPNLPGMMVGSQSPLPLLFPEDSDEKGPAEKFYYESKVCTNTAVLGDYLFPLLTEALTKRRGTSKDVCRILEIGAGTGSFTQQFIPYIKNEALNYEYTYTDTSAAFFAKGRKLFESTAINVNYKILDIEENPFQQGFIPHHYDLIIASFVLHATKDVSESIKNIYNLIRNTGYLIITEMTQPHRAVNLMFGSLEGYWRFKDFDHRPYNCEMSVAKWQELLGKHGFPLYGVMNASQNHSATILTQAQVPALCMIYKDHLLGSKQKSWILFAKPETEPMPSVFKTMLSNMGRNVVMVKQHLDDHCDQLKKSDDNLNFEVRPNEPFDIDTVFNLASREKDYKDIEGVIYLWGLEHNETDYGKVCHPFLTLCKILSTTDHRMKLFVYTRGAICINDNDVALPSASPILGMSRSLQNENPSIQVRCVDLDPNPGNRHFIDEGFSELFTDDGEMQIVYRENRRTFIRFVPWKVPNKGLHFPKSGQFKLMLPPTLSLTDLKFGPLEKSTLLENQVEVQVKAYALNFRDLFAILKPDPFFENVSTVGIDYAGVITAVGSAATKFKVGDAVFGFNLNGEAMPSHIQIEEDMAIRLSEKMTFCEGATLPTVAATAYICLIEVAKIKANETVLIHTASGGVGICAIQIAMSKKCRIIATAGSARKRAFLRNLGVQHVFHSRNTNYEKDIREALDGEGVDVVLNSLTGPGFKEASLAVCNPGARFIEMSKLNIWKPEEVKALRPDVIYELVDLSAESDEKIKKNVEQVKDCMKKSVIQPIPYVRFDASEIREALTYLQKAKHIGKIVCVMPEPSLVQNGSVDLKPPLFSERSSYLITGGFGGIGMEVAKWMATTGAKDLILVGRNPPKEKAIEQMQQLASQGVNVVALQFDVGNIDQCRELLETIKNKEMKLPGLRGIMHAAGVLSDGVLANQNWEKYETVFNAKVKGGWNLHQLTLGYALEHFVMFSSGAANFGSIGQSNHAGANYYLDSLAQYRHSIGLPATSVNWGQWSVGVAADLDVIALRPFTALQGITALDRVMRSNRLQTTVIEADFNVMRKLWPWSRNYLEELKATLNENLSDIVQDTDKFWKEYDAAYTAEGRLEVVKKFLHIVIRYTLKMDQEEVIDDEANFQDMGMDSLMMIEMKNALQISIGKRVKITVNSVRDCKTVNQLSHRLVEVISGEEELPPPSREELIKIIREDCELPEDIKILPEVHPACKPSEIKTVFITGVTGNFGPYVLREVSKFSQIQKIYCLMRESRIGTTKQRLAQTLKDKKLISEINMDIIECLDGDITKPKFGFSDEIFNKISENVDAIFNLAVKASTDEIYIKSENSSHSRIINVFGTRHILDLACSRRLKHTFHASTTVAVSRVDTNGRFWESWPEPDEFDHRPNASYPISKFICDRLVAQAVERGIPCKAFRFPYMVGDSKIGGNVSVLDNHLMLRMMAYMCMGIMPAANIPVMAVPVDICAQLSVKLFFDDRTGFEMYNVSNPYVDEELDLEDLAQEFGYTVEVVEPEDFIEKTKKLEGGNEVVDTIKRIVLRQDLQDVLDVENDIPDAVQAWVAGNKQVFISEKLAKLIPDEYPACMERSLDLLRKDLKLAKEVGYFDKIGLK